VNISQLKLRSEKFDDDGNNNNKNNNNSFSFDNGLGVSLSVIRIHYFNRCNVLP
jgi:hypothetical protein